MSRTAEITRNTLETQISMRLDLDGMGLNDIYTGIGFFDHMLTHISKHGFMDLNINVDGDLDVDCHHTVEDVGIVLGKGIAQALGSKVGIKRYGYAITPMDEVLVLCAIDFSGRPMLCFDAQFTTPVLGTFDTEMVEEFFRAVADNCGMTLHIKVLSGKNNHHIAEGIFKAFGKAMDMAVTVDNRIDGVLSTKGMLE